MLFGFLAFTFAYQLLSRKLVPICNFCENPIRGIPFLKCVFEIHITFLLKDFK